MNGTIKLKVLKLYLLDMKAERHIFALAECYNNNLKRVPI